MKAKTKKVKPARITRLSVSCLYNRGNYENVKYDLSTEVPRGGSPKATLMTMVEILSALRPIKMTHEIQRALEVVDKSPSERSEFDKEHLAEFTEIVCKYRGRIAARDKALESLDDMGGAAEHRDAKNSWSFDDEAAF